MARLYPPITEEVLSAFCLNYDEKGNKVGASINIDFNLNRAVANAEIGGIALRLRTISTNKYVITENLNVNINTNKSEGIALSYDLDNGTCTFLITDANEDALNLLKVGQYYKVLLAFIGLTGVIGYWSTVATIKCVAKPSVTIANFNPNDANAFTNEIVGEYIQDTTTGDSSEKVYSYRFLLFDSDYNLIDDTGVQLHNSSSDIASNTSTDSFFCYKELNENESYYLIYSITTINGLKVSSPKYQVIMLESIDPEDDITLIVDNGLEEIYYNSQSNDDWHPWEDGLIKIYADLNGHVRKSLADSANKAITGNFVILRSSSKDNFKSWQEVRRFRLNHEKPSEKIFYDYTVELGIKYRYAILQYNRLQFYSRKVYAYKRNVFNGEILLLNESPIYNDITADFEDMFLYDGTRQLKIKFNPLISSFKNDLQEQKIDTIGSKHPFIFRNGNVCYKEFPISGLISFLLDNALFFIQKNDDDPTSDYYQMNLDRFEINKESRNLKNIIAYKKLSYDGLMDAINNNIPLYRLVEKKGNVVDINGHEDLLIHENQTGFEKKLELIKTAEEAKAYWDLAYYIYKKVDHKYIEDTDSYEDFNFNEKAFYNKTDLTSENIMSERYFKLLVLDWLTDGKPKLFRSPTEGNYIVRLLNVNLTPKNELGRMIHEFSCTAYEIADFNYQSLKDLGLLKVDEVNEIATQWYSKNISDLLKETPNKKGLYTLNLEEKELVNFLLTGFSPGDKVSILTRTSATPLEITIGTTGTYIYDLGQPVINISILPKSLYNNFSRNILISTLGYASQKFDTIASITTHTEIGELLIGPVDNFFEHTVVKSPRNNTDYVTSKNVSLYEGFKEVYLGEINELPYVPNKYYIQNELTGAYELSTSETYDNSKKYYKYETDGIKLKVAEIMHLHARKREVIPIFYNEHSSNSGHGIIELYEGEATFSLTPFGLGYIKAKSTMPASFTYKNNNNLLVTKNLITWIGTGLGNLTEEELTKARTIGDLVDFTINKCNKDIFCLFEVYYPEYIEVILDSNTYEPGKYCIQNGNNFIQESSSSIWDENKKYYRVDWAPYSSMNIWASSLDWSAKIYGIYDPYLYEWQDIRMSESDKAIGKTYMGWWPRKKLTTNNITIPTPKNDYGLYDPTLIFDYGTRLATISLLETKEIDLDNIKPPKSISIGNGVILEPIYRVLDIDYTIENENYNLKTLKNIYLSKKEKAAENVAKYRKAKYALYLGNILSLKYTAELLQLQDYENFIAIIELLTELARTDLIKLLKEYFTKEKNLINIIISLLRILDLDLIDNLGNIYENDFVNRIYAPGSPLELANNKYIEFFNTAGKFLTDKITPVLYDINTKNLTKNKANTLINNLLNHISSGDYNFASLIDTFLFLFNVKILQNDKLLEELGNKMYLSLYLELIDEKAHQLFFTAVKNSEELPAVWGQLLGEYQSNSKTNFNNLKTGYLIFKPTISPTSTAVLTISKINALSSVNLLSPLWDNYFYLLDSDENRLLTLSENYKDFDMKYFESLAEKINSNSFIFKAETNGLSLYNKILNAYNDVYESGTEGVAARTENYNNKYAPVMYENGSPDINMNTILKYQLGVIENDYSINTIPHLLENVINNVYLEHPTSTLEEICNYIKLSTLFTSLPNIIRPNMEEYILNYITPNSDTNKSARDIYVLICACDAYKTLHNDELTDEQKSVIINTIITLSNLSEFLSFLNNIANNWTNYNNSNSLIYIFNTWQTEYNNVSYGDIAEVNEETFKNYIRDFNNIVNFISGLANAFLTYRLRYQMMSSLYDSSTNIKEVLWEERLNYIDARERLILIKELLNTSLNLFSTNAKLEAYLDFLASYLQYKDTVSATDKEKWLLLLTEAEGMMAAVLDENNSPYNLELIVQEAWKDFLDALADTYKIEIKERFG